MKDFRKTPDGLFICEECGKTFSLKHHLSKHIERYHDSKKDYYDKWIIENENEKLCKVCKKELIFTGLGGGYKNTCSKTCRYQYNNILYIERYGQHPLKNKEKEKQTKKERYGDENYNNREKAKETCIENYGVTHVFQVKKVKTKIRKTKKERYDDEGFNNRQKIEQTNLDRYGYLYTHQNKDIFEKSYKSALKLKPYLNTDLYYQGTYELDFLDNYYEKFKNVLSRAPSIKYIFNNTQHVHHPDFYIKTLNLIVECKNSYLYERDKDVILAKKDAAIAQGYNYIIIIDKDYTEFNKLI